MSQRAVFFDRDGTIIEHFDYLVDEAQVNVLPGVAKAMRRLKDRGFLLVMVTNQSAVARGMLKEKKLLQIHDHLKGLLAEQGAYMDQVYYCPYHPEGVVDKYRRESEMRKPAPGMLRLAAQELDIDLEKSWMIGDDDRDILAGKRAGCRTIILEARGSGLVQRGSVEADYAAVNFQEAANLIIRYADQRPEGVEVAEVSATVAVEGAEGEGAQIQRVMQERLEGNELTVRAEVETSVGRGKERAEIEQPEPSSGEHEEEEGREGGGVVKEKPVTAGRTTRNTQLLGEILREVKALNRQHSFTDFSVPKLLAGVVQMLVILCLILAFWFGTGPETRTEAAQSCLLLGLVLQTMALTFLVMHRQ